MYGIYFHIPFCIRKCFYCDFYSITDISQSGRLIDAICREIQLRVALFPAAKLPVGTIFFGGGTPSLIPAEFIEKIINQTEKYFNTENLKEITIECNPGTIDLNKLIQYKKMEINRLSLGFQSFNAEELKFLQRIHTSEDNTEAINLARKAGFDNISIDLIFSIPGQTLSSLENTLNRTINLNPAHISAYSLLFEPETPLYDDYLKGKIIKTDEDYEAEMYYFIIEKLKNAGYEQYEVSNFTQDGKKCLHNLNYWRQGQYLGFGPSAHSFMTNQRYKNFNDLNKYITNLENNILPEESRETLTKKEIVTEIIYLGLRSEGLSLQKLETAIGKPLPAKLTEQLTFLENQGLILKAQGFIRLSAGGYAACDSICIDILRLIEE